MASERPVPRFFLALIVLTLGLLAWVLFPIFSELILAAVLAAVFWPVQVWLTARVRGRSSLAAGLLSVAVVLLILGPLAALVALVLRDGADGVKFISDTVRGPAVASLLEYLPHNARQVVLDSIAELPKSFEEVMGQVGAHGDQAAAAVSVAVARTSSLLFHSAMMVIALYFFLAQGRQIVRWIDQASPLPEGQTAELLGAFKRVSYAVIMSTVVTSAVQAVVALVGYYIARVPSPVFFGTLTFFVAFIPAIGAAAVCIVAAALLLITGHQYMAIFLFVWGVVVVGLVDNVIKPLLIKKGMEIHGGVVFFALIGGLAAFGAIGLLLGPLIVAMFFALLRMYHRDYSPGEHRVPSVPGMPSAGGAPAPGAPEPAPSAST
jgi:predicted PurR-regulated permease PerM